MDLPSSGDAALTMGKVPCEFRVDRPTFISMRKLRQGAWQPVPAEDGASSTAGVLWT